MIRTRDLADPALDVGALVPAGVALANHRRERYDGTDMGATLEALPLPAVQAIGEQYRALSLLLGRLRIALGIPAGDGTAPGGFDDGSPAAPAVNDAAPAPASAIASDAPAPASAQAMRRAREVALDTALSAEWRAMVERVRGAVHAAPHSPLAPLAVRALHDIRGGAFQALVSTFEMVEHGMDDPNDPLRAFYLVRDQLKIMRNALPGLDPATYARDRARREHGVDLLIEKWSNVRHGLGDGSSARVIAESAYRGPVSERCIEFSALERVLYNLMNNAARFAATSLVRLAIAPVLPQDGGAPRDLRFIVVNVVSTEHARRLADGLTGHLGGLFLGGFTTGGSGVGMSICAEIVAHAYGLSSAAEAVAEGHVGARSVDGLFVAWFHWPTVG